MLRVEDGKTLLIDCAGNFDKNFRNSFLDSLGTEPQQIYTEYIIQEPVVSVYPNLGFKLLYDIKHHILGSLSNYKPSLPLTFDKFLCSFNGSEHVGRQFLLAHLKKLDWFDSDVSTKNFVYDLATVDGNLRRLGTQEKFHNKFFDLQDKEFATAIFSFGHNRFDHAVNIHTMDTILTKCFVHLVSETDSTGYYPFVTEKFLYSVVTKGLFVAYAQPLWHKHVTTVLGFRHFTNIFDYRFDETLCPIQRLLMLTDMLSKFSRLNKQDWHDLYELEKETIEFNFNHYFSQDYLKHLAKYA
jgi:hypothetical protein